MLIVKRQIRKYYNLIKEGTKKNNMFGIKRTKNTKKNMYEKVENYIAVRNFIVKMYLFTYVFIKILITIRTL